MHGLPLAITVANLDGDDDCAVPVGSGDDPRASRGLGQCSVVGRGGVERRTRRGLSRFLLMTILAAADDSLGWPNVTTMTRRYQHVVDELRIEAARRIGLLLWGGDDVASAPTMGP